MAEESQLQITPRNGGSSLSLLKASSRLIARGREDAAALVLTGSSKTIAPMSEVICETCGERKELAAVDDDFCSWCHFREREMAEIWDRWGFDRWGRPLNRKWDEEGQWRDSRAKFGIDELLKQWGIRARWMELRWGFGALDYRPIRRGQAEASNVVKAVNESWGFDGEGNPIGGVWDSIAQGRSRYALEDVKWILGNLGLPLPDDWPEEWSPQEAHALNALEISEAVWPVSLAAQQMVCSMCGENKELIYAGNVCAKCADGLI